MLLYYEGDRCTLAEKIMTFYRKFSNTAYELKRLRDCVALNHFEGIPSKPNDFGILDTYLNKVMDSR
jgi:hypothetical protein